MQTNNNKDTHQDTERIQTSNFILACLLKLHNAELLGMDKTNPRRTVFYFGQTLELSKIAEDFLLDRSDFQISLREFVQVQKQLKNLIYEEYR